MKSRIPTLNDHLSGATCEDFQRLQTPLSRKPVAQQPHSTESTTASRTQAVGYINWLGNIKTQVATARYRAVLAANTELILLYWLIGREVIDRQIEQGWGTKVIDRLARDLGAAFPDTKGFSSRNLNYMRAFAEAWSDEEMVRQVVARLPWGHNVLLLTKLNDPDDRLRYAIQALAGGWSRSTLEANIRDKLVERSGNIS